MIQKNLLKNFVDPKDTNLGREEINHISKLVAIAKNIERSAYKKYADKDRYNIAKYASENGPTAAVRKFRLRFLNLMKLLQDQWEKSAKKSSTKLYKKNELQQQPLHLSNVVHL